MDSSILTEKPQPSEQKFFIPPTYEEEEEEEEPILVVKKPKLTFTKKNHRAAPISTNSTSSLLPKPVSLLTDMLQRTASSLDPSTGPSSGLRRCQSRYCRLDQFFLNAV